MKLPRFNRKKDESQTGSRVYKLLDETASFETLEAYKIARTNLLFMLKASKAKQVVFTSAHIREGKTLTCTNVAITFAQLGAKILIIDGDMRKPQQHRIFKVPSKPGLSDILAGFSGNDCIRKTHIENLYVMTCGTIPPNPSELLASERMDQLLATLSEGFDYVFIDMPPMEVVTDAAVVIPKTAGAVLVVRANDTTRQEVVDVQTMVETVGGKILGAILNGVTETRLGTYKKYSGKYSRYGKNYGKYSDYAYKSDSQDVDNDPQGTADPEIKG